MNKLTTLIICVIISFSITSCKKGCLDQRANNYDEKAKKDDGSCDYGSGNVVEGNDEEAGTGDLKFYLKNDVKEDVQSIEVFVNGKFIGFIQKGCSDEQPFCGISCDFAHQLNLPEGNHNYAAYLVQPSDTGDVRLQTIVEESAFVTAGECKSVLLRN